MFSFVTLGTNDLKKSKIFYDELLQSINIKNVIFSVNTSIVKHFETIKFDIIDKSQ